MKSFNTSLPTAYNDLVTKMDDLCLITNNLYEIIEINSKILKELKLNRNEVVGQRCYGFLFGLNEPCKYCPIHVSRKSGGSENPDIIKLFNKYYSAKSVEIYATSDLKYYLDTFRDVTEIVEKEEKLNELLSYNKAIIQNSSDGIIVYDNHLTHKLWNPAMTSITGIEAHEVLGKHIDEVFPKYKEYKVHQNLKDALNGKTHSSSPLPFALFNNKEGWVKLMFSPNTNSSNEIVGVIVNVVDITHRRSIEIDLQEKNKEIAAQNEELRCINEELEQQFNQLKESESRFRNLFDSAASGILLLNNFGIIKKANPQAIAILGYSEHLLIGKTIKEIVHQDDLVSVERILTHLDQKTIDKKEARFIHGRRSTIWCNLNFSSFEIKGETFIVAHLYDINNEKKMENILVESETRFRSLYENAPLAYQSLDINGNIIDVNPKWLKSLGYSRKEVIGKWFGDFIHPDDIPVFEENFSRLKNTGLANDVQFRLRNKNEKPVTVAFECSVGYTRDGKFKQTYCVFKDVTVEIEAKKELENYRRRLEKAESIAAIGHWRFDLNTNLVNASLGAKRIYGYPSDAEDLTVEEVKKIPLPAYREMLDDAVINLIKFNKPYNLKFQIKQRSTNQILDIHSIAEYDAKNNQLFGVIRDITNIERAAREMAASKEFIESVVNTIEEGVMMLDKNFQIKLWNKKMEEVIGRKSEDVLNKNALKIFPHFKEYHHDKLLRKALKGEIVTTPDMFFVNNGNNIWYYDVYSPYYLNGKIEGVVIVLTDITIRKETENHLRESNEALLKANEELDNFVYRVSHDLRAPITSSLGLARLTQKEKSLEIALQYASLQENSLLKLDKFIKDILDYSRNSRLGIQPVKINFKEIIDGIVTENKNSPTYKNIVVEFNLNDNIEFCSDKMRIEIILNNIISNAFKFSNPYHPNPSIKINVSISDLEAVIIVEDNGIGIDEQHHLKIFQMFYRATDRKPGSGIGLYIVKDCLSKLHGEIRVRSKIDEGTTFNIVVPNLLSHK